MPLSVTSLSRSARRLISTRGNARFFALSVGASRGRTRCRTSSIWTGPTTAKGERAIPIYRFGVTNDIRTLWLDNCKSSDKRRDDVKKQIKESNLQCDRVLVTERDQYKRMRTPNT